VARRFCHVFIMPVCILSCCKGRQMLWYGRTAYMLLSF
jgi:hypothetical protein